ncbi:MAG: DinB family protein [Planctomycetota bacterium]
MSMIDDLVLAPTRQNWKLNGDYAAALVEGLDESHKVAQPPGTFARPVNHPGWILAHLNAYHPLIAGLLRGKTPEDPIDHPYGRKSQVLLDADAYPSMTELVESFTSGHADVTAALGETSEAILSREMPIVRFRERFPLVGSCLAYLVVRHESLHLGQLSTWRRTMGLAPTATS